MHATRPEHRAAFTLVEVSVVVVVIFLFLLVVLPTVSVSRPKGSSNRISCVNNLKNIGLAFRIYSTDYEAYPWQVPREKRQFHPPDAFGPMPGLPLNATNGPAAFLAAVSNELSTPRIAVCPSDKRLTLKTNNWAFLIAPAQAETRDQMVSYFIGLSACEEDPQSILSGDRNLAGPPISADPNTPPSRVALSLSFQAATNFAVGRPRTPVWTRNIHNDAGNLLLGDGSVQQVSSGRMREAFRDAALSSGKELNFVWPTN